MFYGNFFFFLTKMHSEKLLSYYAILLLYLVTALFKVCPIPQLWGFQLHLIYGRNVDFLLLLSNGRAVTSPCVSLCYSFQEIWQQFNLCFKTHCWPNVVICLKVTNKLTTLQESDTQKIQAFCEEGGREIRKSELIDILGHAPMWIQRSDKM